MCSLHELMFYSFEQMEAIHVAATPAELYNAVLVDTPLAPFFEECINEQDLDEMNIEIIRNTLYKSYLESFYNFCKNMGGETEEVMCEILAFEADRRAFIITINSFGTELTKDDREKLYPTCGKLYPDGLKALARADDYEQVRSVAEYYQVRTCQYKFLCVSYTHGLFEHFRITSNALKERGLTPVKKHWKTSFSSMRSS